MDITNDHTYHPTETIKVRTIRTRFFTKSHKFSFASLLCLFSVGLFHSFSITSSGISFLLTLAIFWRSAKPSSVLPRESNHLGLSGINLKTNILSHNFNTFWCNEEQNNRPMLITCDYLRENFKFKQECLSALCRTCLSDTRAYYVILSKTK